MRKPFISSVALALAVLIATPALAQLNGENLLGDFGVKSGSQPAPGIYTGFLYYRYKAKTIKDKNGDDLTLDPEQPGSQTLNAFVPMFIYVSETKLLGGNYGMMAVVPVANGGLEAPGFGFESDIDTGFGDLYVMPFQLGWQKPRADIVTAFALFAPTGRYEAGGDDNVGKGMWSYECSAGTPADWQTWGVGFRS